MATTAGSVGIRNESGSSGRAWYLSGARLAVVAVVVVAAAMLTWRLYQGAFAWKYGMDATAPEFDRYWMNLMYVNLGVILTGWVVTWGGLWLTRDRHLDRLTAHDELRRYINLVLWIFVYAFVVYFAGSFFAEGDASWHQTVVRDTSFTPSHIVLFYGTMPFYVMFGVGTLIYATTRLPRFAERVNVPLLVGVVGPFLILPNLGYNEWGHAFWLMEEWFTAPLHWGFVVLGWSLLALGGVLVTIVTHMRDVMARMPNDA